MHIPDGFLSVPVWASLDVAGAAGIGWIARRAQRETQDHKIPLLGVMGAFVFAAQMINFPVGLGTSGHLLGGALLAIVLGPEAAVIAMTAILALQCLVFQDGGVLALGANVFNMALAGVAAGYLPSRIWGRGSAAIFACGMLSVMVSACLALGELLISGVRMPGKMLPVSLGLFLVSGILEGAITLAAVRAIERLKPGSVQGPEPAVSRAAAAIGLTALLLVVAGTLIASALPDGIQQLTHYGLDGAGPSWARKAGGGVMGLVAILVLCAAAGRLFFRRRSA
jgi:cobalt/nickel transport system permease protein